MPETSRASRPPNTVDYQAEVERLLTSRRGHFLLESGHHGELWLDLELLCLRPQAIGPLAAELANRLGELNVDAVCGPLNEGAFVALLVAAELQVDFVYAERFAGESAAKLYAVEYRIPSALREKIRGRRVAIVNDVINAGSAVRGTLADLERCGATTLAIAPLLVLGSWTADFAAEKNVALHALASLPNRLWLPEDCPMCAAGICLEEAATAG